MDSVTGDISNPGSVVGNLLQIKSGRPNEAAAPGQFYPIQIPPGTEPELCPDCAMTAGGSEGPGGALYRRNISCCNTNRLACGTQVQLDEQTGDMVGPTRQGTECLIHQLSNGTGQDILDQSTTPFQFLAGSNNPLVNGGLVSSGSPITSSDSVITIPLYDGTPLSPGESGDFPFVTVIGFLQMFVREVNKGAQGTVDAYILNVAGCGGGSGGGSGGSGDGGNSGGVITSQGGSTFPVRLVRPAGS